MKIKIISIPVSDQNLALKFYTEKLGFVKNKDVPLGDGNRWLTLVSPEWKDGPELLLEPSPINFEPSKTYQAALNSGAIGGKILGAGGGGYFLFLAKPKYKKKIIKSLYKLEHIDFKFTNEGTKIIKL